MKKRFLAFLLVLATLFALAACGRGESYVTTTSGSDTDGFYTDYLPTDSGEESSTSQLTGSTQTSTTPVTGTPPATDVPVVPTTDSATGSTTTSFKKTWSYSDKTDNANNQGSSFVTETWEPLNVVANRVLAFDQQGKRVVLYDISKATNGNLDKAEIWSFSCGNGAGVKYRTGTKFGDVILVAGSKQQIITYPGGQVKWSVDQHSGGNPHSIEILPSGNVVIASSTDNKVLLYDTSKSNSYKVYTWDESKWDEEKRVSKDKNNGVKEAHGVLWDPAYNVLWVLGMKELIAYTVTGSGSNQALVVKDRYTLPREGGHDLSADFFSKDHLYLTVGNGVFRFDKKQGNFYVSFNGSSAIITYPGVGKDGKEVETYGQNVKGFGVNENNNFFYCFPNFGKGTAWEKDTKAEWCTNQIHFIRQTGIRSFKTEVYTSSKCAFYKVRVFCGKYQ